MSSTVVGRRARFAKSNVSLPVVCRGTTNFGTLRPIQNLSVLPGDRITMDFGGLVRLLPIKLPFLGKIEVIAETFFIPYRLYNRDLRDNNVSTFAPNNVVLTPRMVFPPFEADPNSSASGNLSPVSLAFWANAGATLGYFPYGGNNPDGNTDEQRMSLQRSIPFVQSHSLAEAIGFPVGFFNANPQEVSDTSLSYCGVRAIGYLDIVRNYYLNLQVPSVPTAAQAVETSRHSTNAEFKRRPFAALSGVSCSLFDDAVNQVYYSRADIVPTRSQPLGDYNPLLCLENVCSSDALLFPRSLRPFYNESWINSNRYTAGPGAVSVEVTENSISMIGIRSGSKLLKFQELNVAGGYRYDDFLSVQYDTQLLRDSTIPVFLGSDRGVITSDPIYQTAPGKSDSGVGSGLGAIGGVASGYLSGKKRTFRFQEFGELMVILSVRPVQDYNLALDPMLEKTTLNSLYYPSLDRISFQPLFLRNAQFNPDTTAPVKTSFYSVGLPAANDKGGFVWDGTVGDRFGFTTAFGGAASLTRPLRYDTSLGYQPAWSEYMQLTNRVTGDLATSLKTWGLVRSNLDLFGDIFLNSNGNDSSIDALHLGNGGLFTASMLRHTAAQGLQSESAEALWVPYTIPQNWNYLFDDTAPYAHPIVYEFAFKFHLRRQKSKLNMPSFGM